MMSILIQDLNILDGVENSIKYTVKNVYAKAGSHLYKGKRVCELVCENKISITVKAKFGGVVSKTSIKVGDDVHLGDALIEVKECLHPTILGNICCDCGVVLEEKMEKYSENSKSENLVSMLHSIPDLKVSKEEAARVGYEDIKHLLDKRKLVLLVDLDQTLIHTTNDNIPPKLKDVFHFQLIANGPWYHTRLRPFTKRFLKNISKFYELHICTFGVREYAHYIAKFLDPDRKLFGDRILSRNECLDPMSKKANLSSLFPCGDNLVCIIDDRSDVWNFAPNVVQVMPYHFFQHTGDINAPPELQKKENDNISVGFDFSNLEELTSVNEEKKKKQSSEKVDENEQVDHEDVEEVAEAKTKDQSEVQEETKKSEPDNIISKVNLEEISIERENKATNNEKETEEKYFECEDDIKTNKSAKDSDECEDNIKTNKSANDSDECEDNVKTNKNAKDFGECEYIKTNKSAKDFDEYENDIKTNKSAKDFDDECEDDIKTNQSAKDFDDECEDDIKINKNTDSETIDVEDNDDYLLYLEDNLKKLHKDFYEMYDYNSYISDNILPDLKDIVPNIRKTVLDGCHLVFSGIVPQNTNLTNSKVYHIATSLGATVSEKIIFQPKKENGHFSSDITTHVIAANLHTEKVHQAKKQKHIKIVTPNWLWCCAERWERVDERLFKLTEESEKTIIRSPPMHCFINLKNSSTELNLSSKSVCEEGATSTTNTQENNIFKSVSPLAYMSNDETKSMNDEVDDVLQGEGEDDENQECNNEERESSESEENSQTESSGRRAFNDNEDDVDDDEFDDEEESGRRKNKRKRNLDDDDDYDDEEDEEELPSIRFRQGGSLPSDESDDDTCDDDMNTYGDILERELMRE